MSELPPELGLELTEEELDSPALLVGALARLDALDEEPCFGPLLAQAVLSCEDETLTHVLMGWAEDPLPPAIDGPYEERLVLLARVFVASVFLHAADALLVAWLGSRPFHTLRRATRELEERLDLDAAGRRAWRVSLLRRGWVHADPAWKRELWAAIESDDAPLKGDAEHEREVLERLFEHEERRRELRRAGEVPAALDDFVYVWLERPRAEVRAAFLRLQARLARGHRAVLEALPPEATELHALLELYDRITGPLERSYGFYAQPEDEHVAANTKQFLADAAADAASQRGIALLSQFDDPHQNARLWLGTFQQLGWNVACLVAAFTLVFCATLSIAHAIEPEASPLHALGGPWGLAGTFVTTALAYRFLLHPWTLGPVRRWVGERHFRRHYRRAWRRRIAAFLLQSRFPAVDVLRVATERHGRRLTFSGTLARGLARDPAMDVIARAGRCVDAPHIEAA